MTNWTSHDIPAQLGKRAIVTGATGGLGYETAFELARVGAHVILTGRNQEAGDKALRRIRAVFPTAHVRFEHLDLASLDSVVDFTKGMLWENTRIDLLINNAGVMALKHRQTTADGFEMQLGTNYLGHFALTARLLPLLAGSHRARVVNLSSLAHRQGRIDFDDLHGVRRYRPWTAYAQSKLAMLQFARELQARSAEHGWGLTSLAAHPGWARTDLIAKGPGKVSLMNLFARPFAPFLSHSANDGAQPTLYAATHHLAEPGGYYGPGGVGELKGAPALARVMPHARNDDTARRLWDVSCALTAVRLECAAIAAVGFRLRFRPCVAVCPRTSACRRS
ncbi:MAG: SDR family oxidoreductase [Propionivibrio sp.]